MAWSTPITYVSGAVATAAGMNTYVKDDLIALKAFQDATPFTVPLANSGGYKYGSATLLFERNGATYVGNNVIHNGTNFFVLDSTGHAMWMEEIGDTGGIDHWRVYRSPAGSNPGAFVSMLDLDASGKLTGKGFYDSGEVSIASGLIATVSHGLAARPRFVACFAHTATGTADSKTRPATPQGEGTLPANAVISTVTSTQIQVTNGTASTRFINIYAML